MKTTADRILQRMKDLNLQHKDLVTATGASKGTVTNWISGVNNPTGNRLIQLSQALNTTPEWLLNGAGNPVVETSSNVQPVLKGLRKIPVLDYIQAGLLHEVGYDGINPKGETYTSYMGSKPECVFSLEVMGLSMAPEYMPGDEIVVDAALAPKPGSLVIAQETQHGVARTTFKKYRVIGVNEFGVDIVELVPLNPDFPIYNSTQIDISIIGVVVQHHREIMH
ncbi:LexA family protein [Acinetobacter guillouiae]|uniref:LexA family protein n=1 Tax=Acinetobacter guillouiae TaxID=106649 RepID=UPI003AF5457C